MTSIPNDPGGTAAYPSDSVPSAQGHGRSGPLVVLLPILLGLLVIVAFLPAPYNDFVNRGDEDVILRNTHVRDFSRAHFAWMFTTFQTGRYQPLNWLAFAIMRRLTPPEPFVFHLTGLTIHIINVVLVYAIARKLLARTIPRTRPAGIEIALGATAAAAFFGVHPLRVASVAWAAAQGDLLSAAFYLSAVLAYLHAHDARQAGASPRPWLLLSLSGMALSVLAGNNVATSVAIVLLLDVYPLGRLGGGPGRWFGPAARPVWREKVPFLAIAAVTAVLAWVAHAHIDVLQGLPDRTFTRRLAESLFGLSLGMWKTFWPRYLSPIYAFSTRSAATAIGVLAATGVLAWLLRRRWAAPLAGWLCYAFLLLPLLGVFARSGQTEVDRLTYLACIGWAMVFGGVLAWFFQPAADGRRRRGAATAAVAVAVAAVGGLSFRTQRQCEVWNTSASLWEYAVSHEPDCAMARMYLGEYLMNRGDPRTAAHELSEAARLCPGNGRIQCDLGIAMYELDDLAGASTAFRRAIALDPGNAPAYRGLAWVLAEHNDLDAAMEQLRTAQWLNPDEFRVYIEIGRVLQRQGRPDAAAVVYEEGIRRWPDVEIFYKLRGSSLIGAGQYAEGRKALEMGLKITDDPAELANNLAWLLATCRDETQRDGEAAVRFAELAHRATLAEDPGVTDTLAAAYAEAGRFEDAVRTQKRAIELARFVRPQVVAEFQERLALFEKHQPYREKPSTRPASSRPAASQPRSAR